MYVYILYVYVFVYTYIIAARKIDVVICFVVVIFFVPVTVTCSVLSQTKYSHAHIQRDTIPNVHIDAYSCTQTRTHAHTHARTHAHTCNHTRAHKRVRACTHTHTHTLSLCLFPSLFFFPDCSGDYGTTKLSGGKGGRNKSVMQPVHALVMRQGTCRHAVEGQGTCPHAVGACSHKTDTRVYDTQQDGGDAKYAFKCEICNLFFTSSASLGRQGGKSNEHRELLSSKGDGQMVAQEDRSMAALLDVGGLAHLEVGGVAHVQVGGVAHVEVGGALLQGTLLLDSLSAAHSATLCNTPQHTATHCNTHVLYPLSSSTADNSRSFAAAGAAGGACAAQGSGGGREASKRDVTLKDFPRGWHDGYKLLVGFGFSSFAVLFFACGVCWRSLIHTQFQPRPR